jgi:small conductance mechanosensitive channel
MVFTLTQQFVASIIAVLVTFAIVQTVGLIVKGLARRAGARPPQLRSLRDIINVIWLVLAATAILSITGLASIFTTLTVSGIAGVAVSLALQSTLSNVISGFLLFHDKAIRLHDDIQFGGIRGRIVQIGLRATWVKTKEGDVVVIGNSNLSSGPLVNFTSKDRLIDLRED